MAGELLGSHVLDLGTMAVLVGTVALGLDKVSMDGSPIAAQLKRLRQKCSDLLVKLEITVWVVDKKTGHAKINEACDNKEFYLLLAAAAHSDRSKYPVGRKCAYLVHKFYHAPFLSMMRLGLHTAIIVALTSLSLICFVLQKAGEVFHFFSLWGVYGLEDICLYWIYLTTIFVTLFFASMAHVLAGLEPHIDSYIKILVDKKASTDIGLVTNMMRDLRVYSGSDTPPNKNK